MNHRLCGGDCLGNNVLESSELVGDFFFLFFYIHAATCSCSLRREEKCLKNSQTFHRKQNKQTTITEAQDTEKVSPT